MAGTVTQFLAQLDARLGKPYSEVIDGGVGPNYYDCSGLVEVCLNAIGIPYTRSTYTQWADQRYEHLGPFAFGAKLPPLEIGDVLYMHVAGEDDPGHVGVFDGSGVYIDAPHTGAFVRVETISNTPSEHVWGIIRPPFGVSPTPPSPQPIRQESDMSWFATDPKTGGVWATDPNGDLYPTGGAPFVAALSSHPEYHAGSAESGGANPCVGMAYWAAFGNDGVMFLTQPPAGQGGWDGTTKPGAVPYDIYRFLRSGAPA